MSMIMIDEKLETMAHPGGEMGSQSTESSAATVELVVEGDGKQLIYVANSKPGGLVTFGSMVSDFEVLFLKQSPLLDVPNPMKISSGPSVTTVLDPAMEGAFPFQISTSSGGITDLVLTVSQDGPSYKVGFDLQNADVLALQAFAKQETGSPVDLKIRNDSSDTATIQFSNGGSSFTSKVRSGHTSEWTFIPTSFGMNGTVVVVNAAARGRDHTQQSGGTMHADILVEPPP